MDKLNTPLKLLAGVILASLLIGIFIGIETKFSRSSEIGSFESDAESMANIIESLGNQDPPSQKPYELKIPKGCGIRFEGKSVVVISNDTHSLGTGVKIFGDNLGPGSYNLLIRRKPNGVEVND